MSSSISPDSGSVGAVEIKPKEEEEDQEPRDYLAYLKDIYEAGSMQQAAHENDPEKYFQLGGPKLNSNDNGRSAGLGSSYTPEEIGEEGAKERKEEEERETAELLKLTNEQNPKFQVISTGLGPVIPAGYRLPQGYNDYTIVVQEVPPADIATDGTTVRPGSKAEETRGPPELVYEIKTGSASSLTARCCRYLSGMENIMLYWMLYLALQVI